MSSKANSISLGALTNRQGWADDSAAQSCDASLLESLFWFLPTGYYKCTCMDWSYSRARLGTTWRGYHNLAGHMAGFSEESQSQVPVNNQLPKVWLRTPTIRSWSILYFVNFFFFLGRVQELGKAEERRWVGVCIVGLCPLSTTISKAMKLITVTIIMIK